MINEVMGRREFHFFFHVHMTPNQRINPPKKEIHLKINKGFSLGFTWKWYGMSCLSAKPTPRQKWKMRHAFVLASLTFLISSP